jgi:hypothetical protein
MHQEVLGHLEFWTQFQCYLEAQKIGIRLSKPAKSASSNVVVSRSYFRVRPWRLLRNNGLGVSVHFNEPGGAAHYQLTEMQYRGRIEDRLSPLGTVGWESGAIILRCSTALRDSATFEERYEWLGAAIHATIDVFKGLFPPPAVLKLEFRGEKLVNSDTGEEYDLAAVAARLPWKKQGGEDRVYDPLQHIPSHWYVVMGACDWADWDVLYFACTKHPLSYRGYFRGYLSPMQYLELGDGYRYWPSRLGVMMLNRCTLDSVEPPRRLDEGARPIKPKDWGAPPWLPQGSGWSESYLQKRPHLARELGLLNHDAGGDEDIKVQRDGTG